MKSVNWKDRLESQRDLRKRGLKLLYQRVKILCEVYEDEAFRDWCLKESIRDTEFLDGELSDVGMNFETLQSVLDAYPREVEWINADMRVLVASVMESQKKERKASDGSRETISWKERCLEAEAECERLRAEVASLKERIEEFKEILSARPVSDYRPVGV